jgi:single-strand DNA-binding protein
MTTNIECALIGRLTTDPEARTSQAGNAWCRFRVAVGDGEAVQWVDVACFKDAAQRALERLHKGDKAYIQGNLTLRRWTGTDGVERSGLSVACFKIEPLYQIGRSKSAQARPATGAPRAEPENTYAAAQGWQRPADTDPRPAAGPSWQQDDSIPFAPEVR